MKRCAFIIPLLKQIKVSTIYGAGNQPHQKLITPIEQNRLQIVIATNNHHHKIKIWDTRNTDKEVTVGTPAQMLSQGNGRGLKQRNYITKI